MTPPPRWDQRDTGLLLGLLVLYLLSRWIWIQLAPESAYYWEEAYRLIAVEELSSAPVRPFLDYQADHYQGGSLVAIALALAVAKVVGVGLPMLKIGALIFSAGTLAALFGLTRRFFGRAAALLAGSAYLAGPPIVAFWGVCLMGFHAESVLPSLLLVYVTLSIATQRTASPAAWLGLGLLATANLWFAPIAAIPVAACALTLLALRVVPCRQELVWSGAGALIGSIPWLAYNVGHDWAGIGRLLEVFGLRPAADPFRTQDIWERAADLLIRAPTQGLLDPAGALAHPVWRALLLAAVLLPTTAALLASARRVWRAFTHRDIGDATADPARFELVFWLCLGLFVIAYLASRFTLEVEPRPIAFRLLIPSAVFAIVPVAISGGRWLSSTGWPRIAGALAASVTLLALAASTITLAVRHQVEEGAAERSVGYVVLGRLAQRKYPRPIERALAEIRPIRRAADRSSARIGIGWGLIEGYEQGGSRDELRAAVLLLPEPERGLVWGRMRDATMLRLMGLTPAAARTGDPDLVRSERRLLELLSELEEPVH